MFIQFSCPNCGRAFKVAKEHLGKQGKCQCGHAIPIRENPPAPAPSPPPLIVAPPPAPPLEKRKGFWANVKNNYQATYIGGPFELKAKSDGVLEVNDDGLTFKSAFLRREIFSIRYESLALVIVDTAG